MKYRIHGEVTIYVDYVEEEADSKEIALRFAKDWLTTEHSLWGLGSDGHDINVTAEEIEEEAEVES